MRTPFSEFLVYHELIYKLLKVFKYLLLSLQFPFKQITKYKRKPKKKHRKDRNFLKS